MFNFTLSFTPKDPREYDGLPDFLVSEAPGLQTKDSWTAKTGFLAKGVVIQNIWGGTLGIV